MATYKLISADSHIVEPPDLYTDRIERRFKERAPRMEQRETPTGRKYDAWFIDGQQVGTLGAVMQAGQRFEDPAQIDFLGLWEDVRLAAYDPEAGSLRFSLGMFRDYDFVVSLTRMTAVLVDTSLRLVERFVAAESAARPAPNHVVRPRLLPSLSVHYVQFA